MAVPWGAIATIGSSLVGAGSSIWGASSANRAAKAAARRQMDFQERMTRNRYRYTMQDMRAAGLNPILAYQQGGGAAPAGASYSPANIGAGVAPALQGGVSSAISAVRARQQLKLMDAQIRNVHQDTKKKREETNTTSHLGAESLSRTRINQEGYHSAAAAAEGAKHLRRMYDDPKWGPIIKGIETLGRAINPGASAVKNLK